MRVGYASSEDQRRAQFANVFGEWLADSCHLAQGVIRNDVTVALWPVATLDRVDQIEGKANVELTATRKFNFS